MTPSGTHPTLRRVVPQSRQVLLPGALMALKSIKFRLLAPCQRPSSPIQQLRVDISEAVLARITRLAHRWTEVTTGMEIITKDCLQTTALTATWKDSLPYKLIQAFRVRLRTSSDWVSVSTIASHKRAGLAKVKRLMRSRTA
jgi:hypothetical protein